MTSSLTLKLSITKRITFLPNFIIAAMMYFFKIPITLFYKIGIDQ